MFNDYLNIGPTPPEEDCVQVGSEDYLRKTKLEVNAFINQLEREFSHWVENDWVLFDKKWFNHDFGRYCEVVVYYKTDDETSRGCALSVERSHYHYWDEEAKKELREAGYWV